MAKKFKQHTSALRAIRMATGKSQAIVADELGLSKSTYSAWETGRIELGSTHIRTLSEYFGCTPNDILDYRSNEEQEYSISEYNRLTDEERELLDLFRLLPPNNRTSIIDIMHSCTKRKRPKF